ncbi:MAG: TonB-dependent receptor, partial [Burkholderiales bacterium]
MTTIRFAFVGGAAISIALGGGSAWAQQAPGERVALGEVVVTAQKREETLREVPLSVSVISSQQLEDFHVTRLTDIAAYVPGLQVTSSGAPGLTSISLRGIAPVSASATVATYIDENPLGSSGFFQAANALALDLLPYDIERVEVLRGPQGTLYGASAMGGLLKYVTRGPDLSDGEFRIGIGASDVEGAGDLGRDLRVGANLPLVEGRLALRASYARNEIPGYVDDAQRGGQDINDGTQESARVALLWQVSDAVGLDFTATRQSIDSDNNGTVALNTATQGPLLDDLQTLRFVDEPFEKEIDFYSATLNWDLGWADFISASGYSDVSTDVRQDFTFAFGELPLLLGLAPGISIFDLR